MARSLLDWSIECLPLDEPWWPRHYLDLAAAQMQDAFKQYVKPANLVQVVEGPTPKQH